MMTLRFSRLRRGLSLTEVLIASAILTVVTLGSIGSLVMSSRVSRDAVEDLMAVEFLNRQSELIKSNRFYTTLGVSDFTGTTQFQYDPSDIGADIAPTFDVTYEWYGFGTVTGATSTSVSFDGSAWPDDVDFTGHRILIRPTGLFSSAGIANISDHNTTTDTFTTDCAMNSWTDSNWSFSVPTGAYFEVDGGKWCRVTLEWTTASGTDRELSRDVFIPWRSDPT